jgi:putative ABC transport system permease protein
LGFAKDHLIHMQLRGGGNLWERDDATELWSKYRTLKNDLTQDPNVTGISASACLPFGLMGAEYGQLDWEGKDPELMVEMSHMAVDQTFLKTFRLELIEGRFFSDELTTDSNNFVLNETAAKTIGLASPVGSKFRLLDKEGTIIGVVKDFHFASLHKEINPLILHLMPYQYWMYRNYVFARVRADDISRTLASIKEKWDQVIPEYPFEFHFLDETIDSRYRSEQRFELILRVFTFLAIFISCFGLFGLISFAAEQRTKEIGIRKVLGASVTGIVRLLAKEFLVLVAIANIIAWPVAYVAMNRWLENFAYREGLSLGIFLFSGFLAVLIAILTVSFQSVRAALANPVKSLRYE